MKPIYIGMKIQPKKDYDGDFKYKVFDTAAKHDVYIIAETGNIFVDIHYLAIPGHILHEHWEHADKAPEEKLAPNCSGTTCCGCGYQFSDTAKPHNRNGFLYCNHCNELHLSREEEKKPKLVFSDEGMGPDWKTGVDTQEELLEILRAEQAEFSKTTLRIVEDKCECGSAKCGGLKHSDFCPLYEEDC